MALFTLSLTLFPRFHSILFWIRLWIFLQKELRVLVLISSSLLTVNQWFFVHTPLTINKITWISAPHYLCNLGPSWIVILVWKYLKSEIKFELFSLAPRRKPVPYCLNLRDHEIQNSFAMIFDKFEQIIELELDKFKCSTSHCFW